MKYQIQSLSTLMDGFSPFHLARIKLTAYYMIIFSVILVIFTILTFQAKESAFVRVYTVVKDVEKGGPKTVELQDTFKEFNRRFQRRVILFDVGLWVMAALLAYGLSGKTLQPIADMLNEQAAFAADVSHGLRTPLTTMNMEIEAFTRTEKRLQPQVKAVFASLQEEIAYLKRITEGVLSLTRTQKGVLAPPSTSIALAEVLEKIVHTFKPLAESKGQTISVHTKSPSMIKGNEDQLKQVLTILLDNAIKYGNEKNHITLSLSCGKEVVKLNVADTGPGIKPEDKKRIFTRFYRGNSTKGLARGAGLGLAVAKKIIEAHQGSLTLKSTYGKGTTFTITLPQK